MHKFLHAAHYFENKTKEKRETDRETKKERGFAEFIVLHPQIKLDSVLSQVYVAYINVSIKFQMRVVEWLNLSAAGHSTSVHPN